MILLILHLQICLSRRDFIMLSAAKEKRQHGSMQVPYSYYDCRVPNYFSGVPLHWHGEMELNYVKRGTGYFQYEDRLITVHTGDIILIQPNLVHAILPDKHESMFYDTIVFHQNMLIGGYDDRSYTEILQPIFSARRRVLAPISPDAPGYPALCASVLQIFRCVHDNLAVSDLLLKSELLRFFYLLAATPSLCTDRTATPALAENLRPVLAYIQEHSADPLTIEELASLSHLSKSHFMSCFKQTFGLGAIEYLTQVRLRTACEALRSTTRSVSEIAYDAGFRNLSNFNRQFRSKVGCTPQAYRKDFQKN